MCICIYEYVSILCIFAINPLSDVWFVKIFFHTHSLGCYFVLLVVSFAIQKIWNFMRSNLLIVALFACGRCGLFIKLSHMQKSSILFPTFFVFCCPVFLFLSLRNLRKKISWLWIAGRECFYKLISGRESKYGKKKILRALIA